MIIETLLIVYALGLVLGGVGIGLAEDTPETKANFGIYVALAMLPAINIVFGTSAIADRIRKWCE